MKLGLVSAILGNLSFEEMMDFCSASGLECVEAACWPKGKAERRYAGVTHIDVDSLDEDKTAYIKNYEKRSGVRISSLAFYPNTLDPDPDKRHANIDHIMKLIDASSALGVNMITTFIGRDQSKTVEENLKIAGKVWEPIIMHAETKKVKIAIENCPMLFGSEQWPGGQNLMTTPVVWKKMFEIIPSDYFGLNYDPSHFVWQMIDYIKPLYEFKDKIFHVHFKDIKLFRDKLDQVGIMAYPLDFMSPKIPGLGDVDWGKYVSALTDIGFNDCACIEIEDRAFESSPEAVRNSILLSIKYLRNFVI
jgi:sugar phosphate isomerase/epimerase